MDILRKIGTQFKKPEGVLGKIISNLMIVGNRSAYGNMIENLTINSNEKILEIGYGPGSNRCSKMMGHFVFIWQVKMN
jgi:hypothetical protein